MGCSGWGCINIAALDICCCCCGAAAAGMGVACCNGCEDTWAWMFVTVVLCWVMLAENVPLWNSPNDASAALHGDKASLNIINVVNAATGERCINPNTIKSYKISQNYLQNTHAQSPYPISRHGKAFLSKQPLWYAAGDLHLAHGRSRVRTLAPRGRSTRFFSTLPSSFGR